MSEIQSQRLYEPRRALMAGVASIVTVSVLIAIKTVAYVADGSTGVLAALIDSGADAAGSLMNLLAIHISLKPADSHHRHGHGKIEGLAALAQGTLIAGSAVYLLFEASRKIGNPVEIESYGLGIAVMVVSVLLSIVLVMIQRASLRHAPSLAVEADSAHYGSDIAVNLAVLAALGLQKAGMPAWIDPVVAFLVGLWLCRTAWIVARGAIDMLLDREVSDEERKRIVHCVRSCADVKGLHDLRTRMVGMSLNISFDIEVDADLTLREAHAIAHRVEACLMKDFPNAEIMIHVDPEDDIEDARHSEIGLRPIKENE
jgi:ferrous-iron efflux pump FieF